jgi:hypothetical protein
MGRHGLPVSARFSIITRQLVNAAIRLAQSPQQFSRSFSRKVLGSLEVLD